MGNFVEADLAIKGTEDVPRLTASDNIVYTCKGLFSPNS